MPKSLGPRSWVTGWQWHERILHFEPSWFTAAMSTGTLMQAFINLPYPITGAPEWLRDIAYCLWILDIVLFFFFSAMITIRYIRYPRLLAKNILEFPQSSYMGAIPISLSTIIVGILSFYNYRTDARWVAFAFWWFNLIPTSFVSVGIVTVQTMRSERQELDDVAGLWIMSTVPMLALSAAGGTMLPYIATESTKAAIAVLVVAFCCWSWGVTLMFYILTIYLFRLLSKKLPGSQLLASSFLPVAATTQAAYAILSMSIYLASYIHAGFAPTQEQPPPLDIVIRMATAEAVHWLGILLSLSLLAHASFWVFQASCAMWFHFPKTFNLGLWSTVFPIASYANAWAYLSRDLRNDGMRGWAATWTVIALLCWGLCSVMTSYLGFWKGDLFSAPGCEEWLNKENEEGGSKKHPSMKRMLQRNGTYNMEQPGTQGVEESGPKEDEAPEDLDYDKNGTAEGDRDTSVIEEARRRRG